MSDWFEPLPADCPPASAFVPNGQIFYRLSKSGKVTSDEFLSQRSKCPSCKFDGVPECIARSVSVWDDVNNCLNILKLPRHKKNKDKIKVMQIKFENDDGVLLKTFKPNHFSWWRTKQFQLDLVTIMQ